MASTLTKITTLEDLSNEIFYEVFDYIDAFNIFNSFQGLNARFDCLIQFFTSRLKTLVLEYTSSTDVKKFLRHYPLPTFRCLQSLTLKNIFTSYLLDQDMSKLLMLKRLSLKLLIYHPNVNALYKKQILSLPNLHYLELWFFPTEDKIYSVDYRRVLDCESTPKVKYLETFVANVWTLCDIKTFFRLFPNLKTLKLSKISNPYADKLQNLSFRMSTLITLQLTGNHLDFDEITTLLTACPNLINFQFNSNNTLFSDGYQWEGLLSTMKCLLKLNLNFNISETSRWINTENNIIRILSSFKTHFWLEKKSTVSWILEYQNYSLNINYS